MAEYEHRRQRHLTDLAALWRRTSSAWAGRRGGCGRERGPGCPNSLRTAKSSSPWHRERLANEPDASGGRPRQHPPDDQARPDDQLGLGW